RHPSVSPSILSRTVTKAFPPRLAARERVPLQPLQELGRTISGHAAGHGGALPGNRLRMQRWPPPPGPPRGLFPSCYARSRPLCTQCAGCEWHACVYPVALFRRWLLGYSGRAWSRARGPGTKGSTDCAGTCPYVLDGHYGLYTAWHCAMLSAHQSPVLCPWGNTVALFGAHE